MTVAETAAFVSIFMSAISLFSVIYLAGVKLTTLQVKVDTMWEFTLRRGISEAVKSGLAHVNSPVMVTQAALEMMEPLHNDLKALLPALVFKPDVDIAVVIEKNLGEKILHDICLPHGLYIGACLFIAVEYVKKLLLERPPNGG
jgi:hypothetical protein